MCHVDIFGLFNIRETVQSIAYMASAMRIVLVEHLVALKAHQHIILNVIILRRAISNRVDLHVPRSLGI